jgi:hypothetical protein
MTLSEVSAAVTAAQTLGGTILSTIETADPAVDVPAETAGSILTLVAQLAAAGLAAYAAASGVPITVASVLALLPDAAPLPLPPASSHGIVAPV